MNGWRDIKLKEVSEYVTVGFVGSMADQYVEAGVPFLRSLNIQPFRLNYNDLKYIPESFHDAIKKSKLRPGDVAIVRTGYPGTACVIPADLPDANCSDLVILRPGPELNPHYIAAVFNSSFGQSLVGGNLVGAAQQHFNVTVAKELKLRLPPRTEQDKIAAVLVGLNDLIANNQRRIALLESMAEEIYREWFLRMRFPGAKSAVFEKGVPTDWTHEPILDAFKYYGGATPAKDNPRFWVDGEVHWYTPTDVTGASSPYLEESADKCTDEGLQNCSANLFPAHSIMMTSRATIGAIGINCAPACTNQGFITCIPNQRYPLTYLYHWLKLAKPHFEMLSGGATFTELTKGTFKRIRILTPPEKLVAAYEQLARPMFDQVESLTKTNRRLRSTRDALLPRLIAGKLRVDHLDIQFQPSMQPPTEAALAEALA
ncbi:MAG: restriction endonuclease subunit S [Silanimonas sp.]|nr:restriction endonuclease subunit S [Silanimonas sp.]